MIKNTRLLLIAFSMGLSLNTGIARAQHGTNLAWDDCVGSGNEHYNKTVACANTGVFNLLCTFASEVDIPNLAAVDAYMDVRVSGTISPWWSEPGRWTLDSANPTGATCGTASWSQNPVAFTPTIHSIAPSRVRVRSTYVWAVGQEQQVVAGQEYYSHTLQLHFRSGTAQDPGCATPACFAMADVILYVQGEPDTRLGGVALVNTSVDWQGGLIGGCIFFSPTAKSTWGSVKALYR